MGQQFLGSHLGISLPKIQRLGPVSSLEQLMLWTLTLKMLISRLLTHSTPWCFFYPFYCLLFYLFVFFLFPQDNISQVLSLAFSSLYISPLSCHLLTWWRQLSFHVDYPRENGQLLSTHHEQDAFYTSPHWSHTHFLPLRWGGRVSGRFQDSPKIPRPHSRSVLVGVLVQIFLAVTLLLSSVHHLSQAMTQPPVLFQNQQVFFSD